MRIGWGRDKEKPGNFSDFCVANLIKMIIKNWFILVFFHAFSQ
jgi:hypothetical protein